MPENKYEEKVFESSIYDVPRKKAAADKGDKVKVKRKADDAGARILVTAEDVPSGH